MAAKTWWLVGAAGALAVGGWVLADWLIVTDEERVEQLVGTVTGLVDGAKIDGALGWTDPARQPLEVTFRGFSYRFDQDNAGELRAKAYTHLAPYQGERLNLLQKSVEVKGSAATVTVDTFSRRGRTTTEYELRKLGDRWVLSGVHVR
jgi:hypothetical protein